MFEYKQERRVELLVVDQFEVDRLHRVLGCPFVCVYDLLKFDDVNNSFGRNVDEQDGKAGRQSDQNGRFNLADGDKMIAKLQLVSERLAAIAVQVHNVHASANDRFAQL